MLASDEDFDPLIMMDDPFMEQMNNQPAAASVAAGSHDIASDNFILSPPCH
jgi:hypothetical protein